MVYSIQMYTKYFKKPYQRMNHLSSVWKHSSLGEVKKHVILRWSLCETWTRYIACTSNALLCIQWLDTNNNDLDKNLYKPLLLNKMSTFSDFESPLKVLK